jgi:hypothetical protein
MHPSAGDLDDSESGRIVGVEIRVQARTSSLLDGRAETQLARITVPKHQNGQDFRRRLVDDARLRGLVGVMSAGLGSGTTAAGVLALRRPGSGGSSNDKSTATMERPRTLPFC